MAVLGLHAVPGLSLVEEKHAGPGAAAPGSGARAQGLRLPALLRGPGGCGSRA